VSEENVEIVRRAIAASIAVPPDIETLTAVLDPNHVLTTDRGADKHQYLGVQGFLEARAEMVASWDPCQQEVERVIDTGENRVLALLRLNARWKERGVPVRSPWAMFVTLRGGRIVTSRVFLDQGQALKAAGLNE
jgi:ketosteroid isomerase-like protein